MVGNQHIINSILKEHEDNSIKDKIGDKEALDKLIVYNRNDVIILEKLYLRTRRYYKNPPMLGDREEISCPTCASKKYQRRGIAVTRQGKKLRRYQCQNCGHWFRGKKAL